MRALSIRQPWAWLIVHGFKCVENRDWPTNVRGPILIHAGKNIEHNDVEWVRAMFPEIPLPDAFPVGGIVGEGRVTGCVAKLDDPWFFGPYGFTLAGAKPLPFAPLRGQLGFFPVEWPVVAPERTP